MQGLISSPIARLVKEPKAKCTTQDEVMYGTPVDILDEQLNYYFIKTSYGYLGYVKKNDITLFKNPIHHIETYNGVITKHFVDVLLEPTIESLPIITLPRASYIKVLEETTNGFQSVELINHKKGYILEGNFKYRKNTCSEEELRKNVVSNALAYLNTQYRWGGKTAQGIDCSGLCSISYLLEEKYIYRDAIFTDEMLRKYNLHKINKDDLKPGDLIYAKGHVMMYIGYNQYIHSSVTNSGVAINSLNPNHPKYLNYEKDILGYASFF